MGDIKMLPLVCSLVYSTGLTIVVDSIMWKRLLWPEFEVFWFNSVLNRSSEWGTHPFHWYFTSALPRSLLAAYPLFAELRFIISSVPIFNLSAALAANRIYNNRKKAFWKLMYFMMIGLLLISLGCTIITFLASFENYPSGHALKVLHQYGNLPNNTNEQRIHIDTFEWNIPLLRK